MVCWRERKGGRGDVSLERIAYDTTAGVTAGVHCIRDILPLLSLSLLTYLSALL